MGQPETSPWIDPTLVERLIALWDEGKSVNEIGVTLGVSKNSVCSKIARLHLPKRRDGSPGRPMGSSNPARAPRKRHVSWRESPRPDPEQLILELRALAMEQKKPVVKPPPPAAPAAPRYSAHKTCQWALNDSKPWLWCDAPSKPGYSWCPDHYAVAYTRRFVAEAA